MRSWIVFLIMFNILSCTKNTINVKEGESLNNTLSSEKGYYIGSVNDPRIKYAVWHPSTIYNIRCVYDQISTIVFAEDEVVERIVMNDSSRWLVEYAGNELYIRAKHKSSSDIVQVITNKRKYIFEVSVNSGIDNKDPLTIITMQFIYPNSDNILVQVQNEEESEVDVPDIQEPEHYNFNYIMSKSHVEIHPLRIYDDGVSTYFYFSSKQEMPAFFAIDKFGKEMSVNVRRSAQLENVMIVNGVYPEIILRAGKNVKVIVKNIGFNKEDVVPC